MFGGYLYVAGTDASERESDVMRVLQSKRMKPMEPCSVVCHSCHAVLRLDESDLIQWTDWYDSEPDDFDGYICPECGSRNLVSYQTISEMLDQKNRPRPEDT